MKRDEELILLFTTYLLTEKRAAKNTFVAYRRDLNQFLEFLKLRKLDLKSVSGGELRNFIVHLKENKISSRSIARKVATTKSFFKFLAERYGFENKAENISMPKLESRLPNYLSDEEILKIFVETNKDKTPKGIRNKVIIHLLYASGMRVSELTNLKIDQIHFDTNFINLLGKGKKERSIPIPKPTMTLLRDYLENVRIKLIPENLHNSINNFVFPMLVKNDIQPITRQSIWNILKKILLSCGISRKVSPHTLRHSLATHLLKNGANVRFLQMLLGHEQLSTVQVYTHLETSSLRKIYDKTHPRA